MNEVLRRLAKQIELDAAANERMRLEFGHACALRIKHLLEEPAVVDSLSMLGRYLDGSIGQQEFQRHADEVGRLATKHQGSRSIDGCGHAAVSATYAVANALAGKALAAAEYAAYATVYGEGGYGAVADPGAFELEFRWQVEALGALAGIGMQGVERRRP